MSDGQQEPVIPAPSKVPALSFPSLLCLVQRLELLGFQVGVSKVLSDITTLQHHLPQKHGHIASVHSVLFV